MYNFKIEKPKEIKNLLVVIHGLGVNKINFSYEVKEYKEIYNPDYIYAPFFEQENNGDLQTLFLKEFIKFIEDMEIHLSFQANVTIIGISNGGRFAMLLANILQNLCKNLHLITLATPLKGTKLVSLVPKMILSRKLGKELYEGLLPESREVELLQDIHDKFLSNVKMFSVAGGNDLIVNPPENAYYEKDPHFILNGVDHGHIFAHPETLRWLRENTLF